MEGFLRRSLTSIFVGSLSREAGIKIAVFLGKSPKLQSIRSEKALFCRFSLSLGPFPKNTALYWSGAGARIGSSVRRSLATQLAEEKERVLALPCLQFNMLIDVYLSHACANDIIDVQIGS